MGQQDYGQWKAKVKLEKREGDINACKTPEERLQFLENTKSYEVIEKEGNLLLNEGINALWSILCETTPTEIRYTAANARIGVGNSTTAAAATDTALVGGSTAFKAMEAGFPTFGTSQKAVFKSSFGDAEANFAWNEWTVDNGAAPNKNLNRKVESLGTKSGGTWTLEVSISIS